MGMSPPNKTVCVNKAMSQNLLPHQQFICMNCVKCLMVGIHKVIALTPVVLLGNQRSNLAINQVLNALPSLHASLPQQAH